LSENGLPGDPSSSRSTRPAIGTFSSPLAKNHFSLQIRRATYHQFNALQVTADVLIEKTRAEAT
jgi:hypothetical protein